jgi:hypothetical protein
MADRLLREAGSKVAQITYFVKLLSSILWHVYPLLRLLRLGISHILVF